MVIIRQALIVIGIAAAMATQGCSLAPKLPDPEQKKAALERWNRCLQRFEKNSAHYCDGHRRDVLASYPEHLEHQVDSLLRQKTRSTRAVSIMKTGMGQSLDASWDNSSEAPLGEGTKAE